MKLAPLLNACGLLSALFCSSAQALDTKALATHPYWLKLGHYLPATLSDYKSTIDSPRFFLSAEGKTSPEAELKATIDALYHQDKDQVKANRCLYPARYTWLEQQQGRQARLDCEALNNWREVLNPKGLTLVFPTAFMGNPSSMFGHTLLRVDAKDQTRHKELVAFAINFAAEPLAQDNAALYAVKGIIGSYPGRFTVMPYYRKVREYNDIESRDIWEYPINLSEQEVNRILLHLWEMELAEFDYYFIDENCSYQLLALLELARDDLQLTDAFPLHAIPSDTVTALKDAGLLSAPKYRESFGTRLQHQADEIAPELFDAAIAAKNGDFPSPEQYTDIERAAILELAYEWLNFDLYNQGLERSPTAKRLTQLLYQRSRIKTASPFSKITPPDSSPDQGHGSTRLGLTSSYSSIDDAKLILEWRASYHDLLDSQQGFIPGAKISFLDTKLSINRDSDIKLEQFMLLDAMSLAPNNRVFDNAAWHARAGFERMPVADTREGHWFIQGGYGAAWGDAQTHHYYALASTKASMGELNDHQPVLGMGLEAGAVFQLADSHRFSIEAQWLAMVGAETDYSTIASANWHWQISRNFALRSKLGYEKWLDEEFNGQLTAYIYF